MLKQNICFDLYIWSNFSNKITYEDININNTISNSAWVIAVNWGEKEPEKGNIFKKSGNNIYLVINAVFEK